jgi:hypothetical protein
MNITERRAIRSTLGVHDRSTLLCVSADAAILKGDLELARSLLSKQMLMIRETCIPKSGLLG